MGPRRQAEGEGGRRLAEVGGGDPGRACHPAAGLCSAYSAWVTFERGGEWESKAESLAWPLPTSSGVCSDSFF